MPFISLADVRTAAVLFGFVEYRPTTVCEMIDDDSATLTSEPYDWENCYSSIAF